MHNLRSLKIGLVLHGVRFFPVDLLLDENAGCDLSLGEKTIHRSCVCERRGRENKKKIMRRLEVHHGRGSWLKICATLKLRSGQNLKQTDKNPVKSEKLLRHH